MFPLNNPFEYDKPAASLEEAAKREEWLQTEIKRLQLNNAKLSRKARDEGQRFIAAVAQIHDLGRLLLKHNIDWRKEVVWTDPSTPVPPP